MTTQQSGLKQGAVLMAIAALGFIGYAVVFFIRNFTATGFELGVETLNGVTRDQLTRCHQQGGGALRQPPDTRSRAIRHNSAESMAHGLVPSGVFA